jgi:class 3 adenylate cyclase
MRVFRCFAFVDMCGFTRMNDTLGDDEALQVLAAFRAIVRGLSPDHGIRVGKWLGDGCMFVGTDVRPVVDTVLDLNSRMEGADIVLPLRTGIAAGKVIIFEGDDFIGMAINLASRLCDAAKPTEVLASEEVVAALGDDYPVVALGEKQIPGIVAPMAVWRISTTPELEDDLPLSFAE